MAAYCEDGSIDGVHVALEADEIVLEPAEVLLHSIYDIQPALIAKWYS